MTPNQIIGIAAALRGLLEDGHRQGLRPCMESTHVRELFITDQYHVLTQWREPEGELVTLSAVVGTDGSITDQPAAWPDQTAPDPDGRPGVRVLGDGQPYYSADWLDGYA